MTQGSDLTTRLLRLLLVLLAVLAVLSAAVHVAIQGRIDEVPATDVPQRFYALLSAQTWLQAGLVGGLLVLIGYFVLLPIARQVEESEARVQETDQALDHARRHDKLTGMLDRQSFDEILEHSCAVGQRHNHVVGLMRLQLKGFRGSKSRLDFEAADALVVEIAGCIERSIRAADRPARLGDDEFAILIPEVNRVEGLGRLADRLIEEIGESRTKEKGDLVFGCAIGIACSWPSEADCAADLLHRSAQALEEARADTESAWRYHASVIQGMSDRISAAG